MLLMILFALGAGWELRSDPTTHLTTSIVWGLMFILAPPAAVVLVRTMLKAITDAPSGTSPTGLYIAIAIACLMVMVVLMAGDMMVGFVPFNPDDANPRVGFPLAAALLLLWWEVALPSARQLLAPLQKRPAQEETLAETEAEPSTV